MASIYTYKNSVEITNNAKNGVWNTVDISQFVENEDAIGVIVECSTDTTEGSPTAGCRGINQYDAAWTTNCVANGAFHVAVWFYYSNSKQIIMYQTANTYIKIIGEFRRGIKFHTQSQIDIFPAEGSGEQSTWADRTVTLRENDTYNDIEAVIIGFRAIHNSALWGVRKKGSVSNNLFNGKYAQGIHWAPVGIDENGQYQVYFNAKTSPTWFAYGQAFEIGYIKKGTYVALTDYSAKSISELQNWQNLSLKSSPPGIPRNGRVAVGIWGLDASSGTNPYCSLREFGSTNTKKRIVTNGSKGGDIVKLNKDRDCEVYISAYPSSTTMGLYIVGYELYAPASTSSSTFIIDSSIVENDSSQIIIG